MPGRGAVYIVDALRCRETNPNGALSLAGSAILLDKALPPMIAPTFEVGD